MKKGIRIILTLLIIALFLNLSAQDIRLNKARIIAKNFVQNSNPDKDITEVRHTYTFAENNTDWFYVFSHNHNNFVIISAFRNIKPIIGYSFNNSFPETFDKSSNFGSFLYSYVLNIQSAIENEIEPVDAVKEEWTYYLADNFVADKKDYRTRDVDALCDDKWNQDYPYNIMCPEDPDGPGNHVYAGCVATAMSQIMYYWRFPETGQGSHGYYSNYGYLSADFSNTEYEWEYMQNNIDPKNPWACGLLQYHAGISVEMNYSPNGSGAWGSDARDALVEYFKYPDAQYLVRDNFNITEWKQMLTDEIDNSRPVAYYGYSETAGHAFVCDGYQDDYFHFNFGWGGAGNGFYALNDINGYHNWQQMIRYIYPLDTEYPNYIEGDIVLNEISGSITDGSGPVYSYQENVNATWLIDPQTEDDSVTSITLNFTTFELGNNDELKIYDGANENADLIGVYTGTNSPETLTSSGNQLYVTFTSDASSNGPGFYAEFDSELPDYCQGMVIYEEESGSFTDGSLGFNYGNNQTCFYQIKAEEGLDIIMDFDYFETEPENDFLKIYDGQTAIATFSGSELPGTVIASSGSMMLAFKTDAFNTAEGWLVSYHTVTTGIAENTQQELTVSPNPAGQIVNISFNQTVETALVELADMTGKKVFARNFFNTDSFIIELENIENGLYFIKINGSVETSIHKLLVNH